MNRDVDLSLLDIESPDLSRLPNAPKSVATVDGRIIVTMTNGTTQDIGPVAIPVSKTIANATIDGLGNLVIQYTDGTTAGLGKLVGVRDVVYTCQGSGILTSQDGFNLTFSPLPIDPSIRLNKGVLSPAASKLTYDNYSKFLWMSVSQYGGHAPRKTNEPYIIPLNYAMVNNLNLAMNSAVITLPAGKYYVSARTTGHRIFHARATIHVVNENGTLGTQLAIGVSNISFADSLTASTDVLAGIITVAQPTNIALTRWISDSRLVYSPHQNGVGAPWRSSINYNTYATLEIWELKNG